MAANYLHSLADENPDLQKQIGCVQGVFQIFNRHHFVSPRRIVGPRPKRGHSGGLLFNNGTPERDSSVEKHRLSTESSKDSFISWSPSSPFSNVDYNIDNHQNVDHRSVVKDLMYREARELAYDTLLEQDSNIWYGDEPRELSRSKSCQFKDGFSFSLSKDYPRFSYDGEETDILSIKTYSKITNRRLSLDSSEQSIRTLNSVSLVPNKPSNLSRNPKVNVEVDTDKDLSQTRPPSVVAKLMGLETFPLSKSSKSSDDRGLVIKTPNITKGTSREPTSPCWKNVDAKPISKVPIEAAPWKQRDGARAMTSSTKIRVPVANVYSEVDKRLKNLEFAESGKDLRALKQILEAMQAVEAKSTDHSNQQMTSSESKESDTSNESHIVIMKPAKKGFTNDKTGKVLINESTRGERRSRPSIPRTDSGKPRKQSTKQQPESRTRRQSPNSTPEKSTMHVKVDDIPNSANNIVKDQHGIQSNTTMSFKITREKLKRVEHLVEKLKSLNSSHNESPPTDYIASLCENTNPNNTYISQILLSSGLLLRDVNSFEFHLSGYPINPELFAVLEHTKFKIEQQQLFQVQRKRDECGTANEDDDLNNILVEDMSKKSGNWNGFYGERQVIGMEVERLIFRDLVNEVVMSW
ncbi:hypothetical protein M8C21_028009 [Ambrosia artemisiifolia]|uniref:Uncharacterized protein n=1 Tax=Ambrosia artemisiifolia TaxID=4212 RepID=A0AAD5G9F5_AMBAR|nr:hypothetical protein M8C21_028009 [Ambrosia artemisiifolia]